MRHRAQVGGVAYFQRGTTVLKTIKCVGTALRAIRPQQAQYIMFWGIAFSSIVLTRRLGLDIL